MALTTEQLTAMLAGGYAALPGGTTAYDPLGLSTQWAAQQAPAPVAAPTPVPAAPAAARLVSPTGGEINVPYGAAYYEPNLSAYTTLAGQKESARQFDTTTLLNAARALAALFAAGPQSAAELAFLQGGMGFPAIGGSTAALQDLIGASTRGATGTATAALPGGQSVSVPNTLSGQQIQSLDANRNLAGVLASFAKAAGNPDLFARSMAALLPTGYRAVGSGM